MFGRTGAFLIQSTSFTRVQVTDTNHDANQHYDDSVGTAFTEDRISTMMENLL